MFCSTAQLHLSQLRNRDDVLYFVSGPYQAVTPLSLLLVQICFSGRHVFMGYLGDPVRTSRTIDNQGWLHTGDIGHLDEVCGTARQNVMYTVYTC